MAEQKENKAATAMVVVLGLLGLGLVIAKGRDDEKKEAKVEGEVEGEEKAEEACACEAVPDGESKGMSLDAFNQAELARGTTVEMEHTTDVTIARRIAADHLAEDPLYYHKHARAGL